MAFSNHVKVMFGADTKGFQKGLQQASTQTNKFADTFKAKFAGLLGGAVLVKATKEVINFGAQIGDLSDRLGVSAEFLQKFQYGASQNGIAITEASTALQRFTRRTAEAKAKGGPLLETLNKLGITFNDASGQAKNSEQLFVEFGDALTGMTDPAEKLRIAFQFLDTEGAKLTQMFQQGKPSIEEYGKMAEEMGSIIGNDNVKALQDASGAIEEMGRTFMSLLAEGAKPITEAVKGLNSMLKVGVGIIRDYGKEIAVIGGALVSGKVVMAGYTLAIKALTMAKNLLAVSIGGNRKALKLFFGALNLARLGQFTKALRVLKVAMSGLNKAIARNPFGLLITGVSLLLAPLLLLNDEIEETKENLEDLKAKKMQELANETASLSEKLAQAKIEGQKLKEEFQKLIGLTETKVKLPLTEQLKQAKEELNEIVERSLELQGVQKGSGKSLKEHLQILQKSKQQMEKMVEFAKQNKSDAETQTRLKKQLASINLEIETSTNEILKIEKAIVENEQTQVDLKRKIADEETARLVQMEHLFDGTAQHIIDLKRETEILKALQKGGKKLADEIKERHKFEDMVLKLHEKGNISLQEAVDHVSQRLAVGKEINFLEDQLNVKATKRNDIDEQAVLRAKELLEQRRQNKKVLEDELKVLELRAQGLNGQADALAEQLRMRKEALDIAEQLGVHEAKGIELVAKRAFLLKEGAQKELDAQAERIRADNIMLWAQKEIDRKTTRADRRRIRDAQKILRWEEQIRDLKDKDDPWSKRELKRLEALKNQKMKLVIDDEAKQALEGIAGEKLKLEDQHKAQMKGLNDRLVEIQKEEARIKAIAKQQEAKIKKAGEQQQEANAQAMNEIADASVAKIKGIMENMKVNVTSPKVEVNVAPPSLPSMSQFNPIIKVENELKQETLESIEATLQGKFVNQ
jgi:hypothetical protein